MLSSPRPGGARRTRGLWARRCPGSTDTSRARPPPPPPFVSRLRARTFKSACGRRWTLSPTARRTRTGISRPRCGARASPRQPRRSAERSDAIPCCSFALPPCCGRGRPGRLRGRSGGESMAACARGSHGLVGQLTQPFARSASIACSTRASSTGRASRA